MVCAYLAYCIPLEFINDTVHIIVVIFCLSKILFWFYKEQTAKREYVKNSFLNKSKKLIFFPFHNEELKQCLLLSCLMSESLLKNRKKK